MPILICPQCGKEFKIFSCHIRGKTNCCSYECSHKYKEKKPKTYIFFSCKYCGKETKRRKGAGGTFEYCSRKCSTTATYPKRKKSYKSKKEKYSGRSYSEKQIIKFAIKNKGKCEICNSTLNLQGHHILSHSNYPELREDVNNIQILCKECHSKQHPELSNFINTAKPKTGIEIKCIECGKMRYITPYLILTAKFCSKICQLKALHRKSRKSMRP